MIPSPGVNTIMMMYFALMCPQMDLIGVKMNKQFYHMLLDVKTQQQSKNTDFSYKER